MMQLQRRAGAIRLELNRVVALTRPSTTAWRSGRCISRARRFSSSASPLPSFSSHPSPPSLQLQLSQVLSMEARCDSLLSELRWPEAADAARVAAGRAEKFDNQNNNSNNGVMDHTDGNDVDSSIAVQMRAAGRRARSRLAYALLQGGDYLGSVRQYEELFGIVDPSTSTSTSSSSSSSFAAGASGGIGSDAATGDSAPLWDHTSGQGVDLVSPPPQLLTSAAPADVSFVSWRRLRARELCNYAEALAQIGAVERALQIAEDAVSLVSGENRVGCERVAPAVLCNQSALLAVVGTAEQSFEAVNVAQEALDLAVEALGRTHEYTVTCLRALAFASAKHGGQPQVEGVVADFNAQAEKERQVIEDRAREAYLAHEKAEGRLDSRLAVLEDSWAKAPVNRFDAPGLIIPSVFAEQAFQASRAELFSDLRLGSGRGD